MSDKKKSQCKAYSGLDLLRDLFCKTDKDVTNEKEAGIGVSTSTLTDVIPAFLTELSRGLGLHEIETDINDEIESVKENAQINDHCEVYTNSYRFNENGEMVNIVHCFGLNKALFEDSDKMAKWLSDLYCKTFSAAYAINCDMKKAKQKNNLADNYVISEIQFKVSAKSDVKENLALSPWRWDKEMRSFYFTNEEGEAHYVRFFVKGDEVEVCRDENGIIITDVISPEDRNMFINAFDNIGKDTKEDDKMLMDDDLAVHEECCKEKCDKLSCCDKKNECGAEFDNNAEESFNDCRKENRTLVDTVSDNGYIVDGYAIREFGDNEYSAELKKLYKDILCRESSVAEKRLEVDDLIRLFKYMLDNGKYEYGYTDDKNIVISVSYEEMMDNIDKLTMPIIDPDKSKLPWFMVPEPKQMYSKLFWYDFDHKEFATKLRELFNFDEVLLVDVEEQSNNGTDSKIKHCVFCSFEAM